VFSQHDNSYLLLLLPFVAVAVRALHHAVGLFRCTAAIIIVRVLTPEALLTCSTYPCLPACLPSVCLPPGSSSVIRYTAESRPPWLPPDLAWSSELVAKAQQRELELLYKKSRGELWLLTAARLRQQGQL
jgi:hypothetical protein